MSKASLSRSVIMSYTIVVCASVLGLIAILLMERHSASLQTVMRQEADIALEATSMYAQGLQMGQATRNAILEPKNPKAFENHAKAVDSFSKVVATLKNVCAEMADDHGHRVALSRIESEWNDDVSIQKRILELSKAGDFDAAVEMLRTEETPKWRLYKDLIIELVDNARKSEALAFGRMEEMRSLSRVLYVLGGVGLIVVSVMGLMFTRIKVRRSTEQFETLAEIGRAIPEAISVVADGAQKDAEHASMQAAAIEETSATMEEISGQVRSAGDSAREAVELVRKARSDVETGNKSAVALAEVMTRTSKASDEIADIVKTIDAIAFQTNILALNAAVEAARAGEYGAGFSVVAEEVRALAQRSASAAKETATRIEQALVNSREGAQRTEQLVGVLSQIDGGAESLVRLIESLSGALEEQSRGIEQINAAVHDMDKSVQSGAAEAEMLASAAQDLSRNGEVLNVSIVELRGLLIGAANSGKDFAPRRGSARMLRS
ncbi:MAG: MCP four helix bundle domain-containing protein [Opitutales bacterium]|nr:MCP four helix bundle domain-containing protein [Opitutales bacterium]